MSMLKDPSVKYRRFPRIRIEDRQWPDAEIVRPPVWCSVDLRDGNQALIEPMDPARKRRMFEQLVDIGFKEIEVGFPSASQTDFDFVRQIIDEQAIPADVTIQVLTQAREDLIARTFESLKGARRAIVHVYHATAPVMRDVVFKMSRAQVIEELALRHARLMQDYARTMPETEWVFQYSPEMFSSTELDFSREIVDAVTELWAPTPENPCIINLPSTVECCTPNSFADMVEWMHRNIARRDSVVLSVHPHNDRGTGTASAELAIMAGAARLEGCLFGNGERTGNLDLVNVALNLYTQGVHPGLELSDMDAIRDTVEHCNRLPVHPRHPYVGDLVYTSFSGSHQDAIKKALQARRSTDAWNIPYLPVDPADLGRNYQAVIRVNSQSGKGGITFLLERDYGLALPRRAQIEFSQAVQARMDDQGVEFDAADIWRVLEQEYLDAPGPLQSLDAHIESDPGSNQLHLHARIELASRVMALSGNGESAAHAFSTAFASASKLPVQLGEVHEQVIDVHGQSRVAVCVEVRVGQASACHGIGIDADAASAAVAAVVCAVNRSKVIEADAHAA